MLRPTLTICSDDWVVQPSPSRSKFELVNTATVPSRDFPLRALPITERHGAGKAHQLERVIDSVEAAFAKSKRRLRARLRESQGADEALPPVPSQPMSEERPYAAAKTPQRMLPRSAAPESAIPRRATPGPAAGRTSLTPKAAILATPRATLRATPRAALRPTPRATPHATPRATPRAIPRATPRAAMRSPGGTERGAAGDENLDHLLARIEVDLAELKAMAARF
jgi:hypothetical protein